MEVCIGKKVLVTETWIMRSHWEEGKSKKMQKELPIRWEKMVFWKTRKCFRKYVCVCVSYSVMLDSLQPHELKALQAPPFMKFSRQEYWVGCHFLLQGIFPTQGYDPGLPHCKQILYCLSHQGSPFRKYGVI